MKASPWQRFPDSRGCNSHAKNARRSSEEGSTQNQLALAYRTGANLPQTTNLNPAGPLHGKKNAHSAICSCVYRPEVKICWGPIWLPRQTVSSYWLNLFSTLPLKPTRMRKLIFSPLRLNLQVSLCPAGWRGWGRGTGNGGHILSSSAPGGTLPSSPRRRSHRRRGLGRWMATLHRDRWAVGHRGSLSLAAPRPGCLNGRAWKKKKEKNKTEVEN